MKIINRRTGLMYFLFGSVLTLSISSVLTASADEPASEKTINARIIGGSPASQNAWPWMVGILKRDEADNFYAQICGGSLIHSQWVMTAAHCFVDENNERIDGAGIDVLIGTTSLSSKNKRMQTVGSGSSTTGGKRIQADQVIIHPDFDTLSLENDIALLHLKTPVTDIQPVSLPGKSYDLPVVDEGANSTLIGWGTTSADSEPPISSYPDDLMQVDVSVISEYLCKLKMGSNSIKDTMICTLSNNKDSCQGDSGGPMVTSLSGEVKQVGIISWGYGCAQPNYPGVNTRVSKYETFINDHVCTEDKPETPTISMTQTKTADGYVAVDVSFSKVDKATKYRLYYAPYIDDFDQVAQIRHIDMDQAAQYIIASGAAYYIAGKAVNVNCVSDWTETVTVPGI